MARLAVLVLLATVAAVNSQYVGLTPFGYTTTAHSYSLPFVGGFRYGFPAVAAPVAAPLAAPFHPALPGPFHPAPLAPAPLPAPFHPGYPAPFAPALPAPVAPVPALPAPAPIAAAPAVGPAPAILRV